MKLCKDCDHFNKDGKTPELCWRKEIEVYQGSFGEENGG